VTKTDDMEWDHIKPALLGAIMEHFQSGAPVLSDGQSGAVAQGDYDAADESIVVQIKELLDTRVRPAVAQDGGDITFHGFDRGIVYLHMKGACAGCPSSTLTLKMGIENFAAPLYPGSGRSAPCCRLTRLFWPQISRGFTALPLSMRARGPADEFQHLMMQPGRSCERGSGLFCDGTFGP
jgi:Fe-S cluster biogenesis protein NfuA